MNNTPEKVGDAYPIADDELLSRAHDGDRDAFGELWRRHAASASRIARRFAGDAAADELVENAFDRVVAAPLSAGGTVSAFRARVVNAMRTLSDEWSQAWTSAGPADTAEPTPISPSDRAITLAAFRSLPERWKLVLWYGEVEGMDDTEIAPLLGLGAKATSTLHARALSGMKDAWLKEEPEDPADSDDCRAARALMSKATAGEATEDDKRQIAGHAAVCSRCHTRAAILADISGALAMVLIPLVFGRGISSPFAIREPVAPPVEPAGVQPVDVNGPGKTDGPDEVTGPDEATGTGEATQQADAAPEPHSDREDETPQEAAVTPAYAANAAPSSVIPAPRATTPPAPPAIDTSLAFDEAFAALVDSTVVESPAGFEPIETEQPAAAPASESTSAASTAPEATPPEPTPATAAPAAAAVALEPTEIASATEAASTELVPVTARPITAGPTRPLRARLAGFFSGGASGMVRLAVVFAAVGIVIGVGVLSTAGAKPQPANRALPTLAPIKSGVTPIPTTASSGAPTTSPVVGTKPKPNTKTPSGPSFSTTAATVTSPLSSSIVTKRTATVSGHGVPGATVRITELGSTVATAMVNLSGSWSVPITLSDGAHTLSVTELADGYKRSRAVSVSVTVDTLAPSAPRVSTSISNTATGPLSLSGTGEAGAIVRIYSPGGGSLGSATVNSHGAWSSGSLNDFSPTWSSIRLTQTDASGHVSSSTTISGISLRPTVDSPTDGSTYTEGDDVSFSLEAWSGAQIEVLLDGAHLTTTGASGTLQGITAGDHQLTFQYVSGSATSTGSASVSISVAAAPPAATP